VKDKEIIELLTTSICNIEADLKDWEYDSSVNNNYMAYGPYMKETVENLTKLLNHFEGHMKFEKEISEYYNESWPDFVEGDIG